jgi:hypothetical protein
MIQINLEITNLRRTISVRLPGETISTKMFLFMLGFQSQACLSLREAMGRSTYGLWSGMPYDL